MLSSRSASADPRRNAFATRPRLRLASPTEISTQPSRVITDPAHAVIVAETAEKKFVGSIPSHFIFS